MAESLTKSRMLPNRINACGEKETTSWGVTRIAVTGIGLASSCAHVYCHFPNSDYAAQAPLSANKSVGGTCGRYQKIHVLLLPYL